MTSARIEPFCRKYKIELGYYDGCRVYFESTTERNLALKMHENHFCLIWKSDGISFDEAVKELKDNFKVVDNVISDKLVKSFIKDEYRLKNAQPQLTNMIVYDLETTNTDKAVPFGYCICRLNKISGKNIRDITEREYENFTKDCIVFKETDSNNEMLDYVLQFKGEAEKSYKKLLSITFTE